MINFVKIIWKLIKVAIIISLIQHFEANFPKNFEFRINNAK